MIAFSVIVCRSENESLKETAATAQPDSDDEARRTLSRRCRGVCQEALEISRVPEDPYSDLEYLLPTRIDRLYFEQGHCTFRARLDLLQGARGAGRAPAKN